MKRKRLQTPHDRFFKAMFGKTAVVSSFVCSYLFPDTKVEIDFSLSSAIKNDTVDGFLNEFRSDIVYRLFDKTRSLYIYLLFEHKSTPDKRTLIQLKHYLNSVENDIPESEKHEGPILVVIYHGRRKWDIPLSFDLDQSILKKNFSRLQYLLFDISHTPDEKIVGSPQLRLALMGLKYVRTRSIIKKVDLFLVILKEMINEADTGEYVDELSLYIDSAAPLDLRESVLERIKTAIITGEYKMSSIKEYFKQEGLKEGIEIGIKKGIEQGREQGIEQGREQGIEQGREQGIEQGVEQGYKRGVEQGFKQGTERGIKQGTEKGVEQVALNMLKNGEPAEKVAFYTGLSIERIAFLQKQIMNEKQW